MKTLKIEIKSLDEFENEALNFAKNFDKKKAQPIIKGTYFESLEAVRKVLTDKRLQVWRAVRDQKPETISQLADLLERSFRAVHRDVQLLVEMGLIELQEKKGKRGTAQRPRSLVDEVVLSVA